MSITRNLYSPFLFPFHVSGPKYKPCLKSEYHSLICIKAVLLLNRVRVVRYLELGERRTRDVRVTAVIGRNKKWKTKSAPAPYFYVQDP
jgi:hypothetical protein